jgi:hypothetical protein
LKQKRIADWAAVHFGDSSLQNIPDQWFSETYFNYERETPFVLTHGGDARSPNTGRYTMQFLSGDIGSQRSDIFTAGRCGVLIED